MKKKTIIILFPCLSACVNLFAQTGKEWDQPTITNVNREQAHTVSIPMEKESDVTKNDMEASPYYQSLDGTWKFLWVKTPALARDIICSRNYNDSSWSDIDVPASWQVYGLHHKKSWDKPLYCNVAYPFSFNEASYSVMADRPNWFMYNSNMPNPVGTYRRKFTIPATWTGRDVYVRFNGVGHGYYLWIKNKTKSPTFFANIGEIMEIMEIMEILLLVVFPVIPKLTFFVITSCFEEVVVDDGRYLIHDLACLRIRKKFLGFQVPLRFVQRNRSLQAVVHSAKVQRRIGKSRLIRQRCRYLETHSPSVDNQRWRKIAVFKIVLQLENAFKCDFLASECYRVAFRIKHVADVAVVIQKTTVTIIVFLNKR